MLNEIQKKSILFEIKRKREKERKERVRKERKNLLDGLHDECQIHFQENLSYIFFSFKLFKKYVKRYDSTTIIRLAGTNNNGNK